MEQYHSVQAEGYHCGRSAYFIRLAGCDVGCSGGATQKVPGMQKITQY